MYVCFIASKISWISHCIEGNACKFKTEKISPFLYISKFNISLNFPAQLSRKFKNLAVLAAFSFNS